MHKPIQTFIFLVLLYFSFVPAPVLAVPAISCHCFTERSYQAERPTAADQYFLATTQNSFFAAVFRVDKKTVVIKKQQGVSSDDLWVAYWIASRTGGNADSLLQGINKSGTWSATIKSLRLDGHNLGSGFARAMDVKADSRRLAEIVVDGFIVSHNLASEIDLSALRQAGANNQELIIAAFVASRSKQPAKQLYQNVKKGYTSWGEQLHKIGINASNIQKEISGALHK